MYETIKAQIEDQQDELAAMTEQDEKLALVALNSFIMAYELLRPAV